MCTLLCHRKDDRMQHTQELINLWINEAGADHLSDRDVGILALRVAMKQSFQSIPVVAWIDNEAARFALMKGTAGVAQEHGSNEPTRASQLSQNTGPLNTIFDCGAIVDNNFT